MPLMNQSDLEREDGGTEVLQEEEVNTAELCLYVTDPVFTLVCDEGILTSLFSCQINSPRLYGLHGSA